MTEDNKPNSTSGVQGSAEDPVKALHDTMNQFLSAADIKTVFGSPVHEGGVTVIPCAEVISVMGVGLGSGYGTGNADNSSDPKTNGSGGGGGGGGGGRVLSRPVAALVITSSGVEVKPIIDVTKLALAGITAWGFMLTMAMRMSRRHRPGKLG